MAFFTVFAQTGLLALTIVGWLFSSQEAGQYGLAFRIAQLLWFPMMSGAQVMLPVLISAHSGDNKYTNCKLIIQMTRIIFLVSLFSFVGFLLFGEALFGSLFKTFDHETYYLALILGMGNVVLVLFGLTDQGLTVLGRQKVALIISVISASALAAILVGCSFFFPSLYNFAVAVVLSSVARTFASYCILRRAMGMGLGIWDRAPLP